jgi:hypothetical protein
MEPLAERRILLSRPRDDRPHALLGFVVEPETLRMTRCEAAGRVPLATMILLAMPPARRFPAGHGQSRQHDTSEQDADYETHEATRAEGEAARSASMRHRIFIHCHGHCVAHFASIR